MASGKAVSALAGLAIVAFSTAGQGQPADGSSAEIAARERATNCALLDALLKRRAEIAASVTDEADRNAALDALDRRIAQVRRHVGD